MSAETLELLRVYSIGTVSTAALGAAGFSIVRRFRGAQAKLWESAAVRILAVAAIVYVVEMITMGVLKSAALNQYADRATHLEILWRATHGLGLTSPMSEEFFKGSSWFAAHFTPIIYLTYLPAFWAFPSQTCLTVVQTLSLAAAALPVFIYARDRLGASAAGWTATAFLLYPTLHYINLYGTAYLDLSIPLLAWTLLAFERGDRTIYWLLVAACLLVREEMGLVVAGLGLYAMLRGRRLLGIATALIGFSYFVLALKVIIPSFRSDQSLVYMSNYRSWGGSPAEILKTLLLHPVASIQHLLTLPRLGNVVMYLLPVAFLPFAAPLRLLVALPNIGTTFLSDSVTNYNFTLYYLSPTIPVVFFAAVDGLESLRRRFDDEALLRGASAALVMSALGAQIFFGPSPLSLQFWSRGWRVGTFHTTSYHRSQYVVSDAARAAQRVAARVPKDARISAEQHLLPLLYDRRRIAVFPVLDGKIDWVMIDRAKREKTGWAETYLSFREDPERYYAIVEKDSRWELVAEEGGARLFRRRGAR